jgi:hypothetical protein
MLCQACRGYGRNMREYMQSADGMKPRGCVVIGSAKNEPPMADAAMSATHVTILTTPTVAIDAAAPAARGAGAAPRRFARTASSPKFAERYLRMTGPIPSKRRGRPPSPPRAGRAEQQATMPSARKQWALAGIRARTLARHVCFRAGPAAASQTAPLRNTWVKREVAGRSSRHARG